MKKILLTLLSISTIYFAQAQCEIYATVANDSANCNQSVQINLEGFSQVFINEIFTNFGPTSPSWASTSGATYSQPYIPSNEGGAYFWMGPSATVPTALTTTPFNLTGAGNGQICFEFVYADGSSGNYTGLTGAAASYNGTAPEQPDQYDEGITIQYNTGSGWIDIVYYAPNGDILPTNPSPLTTPSTNGIFETWTNVCVDIPVGAITGSTQFRWFQEANSGDCCDHWGLDDISIVTGDPSYNIYLLNNNTLIGGSPDSIMVDVTSDSSFFFLFTNGIVFCQDTVEMFVNPTNAGPPVTISCSTLGTELSITGISPNSNVTWSPALGLNNTNIQNPYANPVNDQMYTVTSDCGIDSTLVNVVPLFIATAVTANDSICVGDNTTLSATSNQTSFGYTYIWTPTTVTNVTTASTSAFPTVNTTYVVEMVSDSGCVRQDSVTIFVGAIPKTINYAGDMQICSGDSTQITVTPIQPTFFDDFQLGANPSIWSNVSNGTANVDCGSVSGNALHFDGVGPRGVQTYPVNASLGGTLSFYIIQGSDYTFNSPCAYMGFSNTVSLQYSTDGGVTWVNIITYNPFDYTTWTLIQQTVPVGAQTANTIFRLHQPLTFGNNSDNWAIDNFLLELNCSGTGCVNYSYNWSPNTNISNPNIANPYFYPTTSTYYSVSISPEGFNCSSAADSILISVDELNVSVTPKDTFLCEPSIVLLDGFIDGFANSCEQDYVISTIPIGMKTGTPTTIGSGDDVVSAAIPIPFNFEFYCETKNSFRIGSNGFVTFANNTASGCCSGQILPNTFTPNDLIALMWSDLNANSGTVSHFVTGSSPNRIQVIQYTNVPHFGNASATVTGQIQLYEYSNIVEVHCQNCMTDGGIITMGLENSTGTVAHTPAGYNASNWSATNQAWRFIPTNSPANFNYFWTPNVAMSNDSTINPLVTPTSSTDYVFNVRNINNCLFTDTAKVGIYQSNIGINPSVSACFGDSIQLNASGADTYVWTPSLALSDDSIANPLTGTTGDITYTVTYNTRGCEETRTVLVDILNLPQAQINNNVNPVVFCAGDSATLFVDNLNGWAYSWNGPEFGSGPSFSVTTPGYYEVQYNDGNCINTTGVTVISSPKPVINLSGIDKVLCCNDDDVVVNLNSLVTTGVLGKFYVNGVDETGNSVTYLAKGENGFDQDVYKVISIDGCESDDTYLKIETNCINPSFTNPDTIFVGTSELFDLTYNQNGENVTSFAWTTTDNSTGAIVDPNVEDASFTGSVGAEGNYTANVTVSADYGNGKICTETAESKNYVVVSLIDPEYPDAFTPNGDGLNDVYRPIVNNLAKVSELRIYNRWGDIMYDINKSDNKNGWDGTHNGKKQPSDNYVYYTKIVHPDGKEFLQEGTVTLIR